MSMDGCEDGVEMLVFIKSMILDELHFISTECNSLSDPI